MKIAIFDWQGTLDIYDKNKIVEILETYKAHGYTIILHSGNFMPIPKYIMELFDYTEDKMLINRLVEIYGNKKDVCSFGRYPRFYESTEHIESITIFDDSYYAEVENKESLRWLESKANCPIFIRTAITDEVIK